MDAYIISYFGKGSLAYRRQALHYQQLCVLLQHPDIEDIHILAMDYDAHTKVSSNIRPANHLFLKHPRIHYTTHHVVPPSQARNLFIKKFNTSNKPWGLFLDNDAYIDPRFQGETCIATIEQNADTIAQFADVLSTISARHHPFTEKLEKEKQNCATHFWLAKQNYLKTTAFFLRNRTYYGETPILFNEELAELEDFEFVGRVLAHGGNTYMLQAVIMLDLGLSEELSTLFQDKDRTEGFTEIKQQIFDNFKHLGLKRNSKGGIQWNSIDKNKHKPEHLWIPYNKNTHSMHYGKTIVQNNFAQLFEV